MKLTAKHRVTHIKNAPSRIHIQEKLLNMLISQKLRPGERIVESRLCNRLGVSRTPLREALFKLEHEGFIKNDLARGFSVKPFSSKEARELYPVIWTLECLAIQLSQSRIGRTIEKLRLINKELSTATGNAEKIVQIDTRFHEALTEQCHNQYLLNQLSSLRQLILRYDVAYMREKKRVEKSVKQHNQIIEALAKMDLEQAQAIVEQNWRQGMDLISDWLEWDKKTEVHNG